MADKMWDGDAESSRGGRIDSKDATSSELRAALLDGATAAYRDHPRSQQIAVGPSQVGVQCDRQLVYDLHREAGITHLLAPPGAEGAFGDSGQLPSDGWRATIGTATHAWLEAAYARDPDRWLTEHRVEPTLVNEGTGEVLVGLTGTADLYDKKLGCVIDHKILGKWSLDRLLKDGPTAKYRVQSHLYGLGFLNAGYQVKMVAIAAWPRDGITSDMRLWSEPFDLELAEAALLRLKRLRDSLWDSETVAPIGGGPSVTVKGAYVGTAGQNNLRLWDARPYRSDCRYCPARALCPDSAA